LSSPRQSSAWPSTATSSPAPSGSASEAQPISRAAVLCCFFFQQKPAYELSDYRSVHPSYGALDDFKIFLEAAHQRGIRVIIEMVLNHTSNQHPWFQESRSSLNNPKRDWYVWSETDTRYRGTRIIFLDTELSNW